MSEKKPNSSKAIGSKISFLKIIDLISEWEGKAGAYAIQDGAGGGLVNYAGRVDKDVTSWTGEMRMTLVYQFGQHLTTHVGYEAVMISRLALASQNFETDLSILANGPWVLDNGGTVVYHGPSIGATFAW